jgi:predicted HTH domain antitoxin
VPSISARIPDDEREALDEVAELLDEDRSTTIRTALREGLHDIRVRVATERYQSGEVSVNQAARIAGVSLGEWLEVAPAVGTSRRRRRRKTWKPMSTRRATSDWTPRRRDDAHRARWGSTHWTC